MVKLGVGLTYYFLMCTLVTSLLMVAGNIRNKFKSKEQRAKEDEENKASLDEAMMMMRATFKGMDDNSIRALCLIIATYVPGINFIVWKSLLFDILGLEAKL